MDKWQIHKIQSDEVITEENLTDKSYSIRFKGVQNRFSNLSDYIVALDDAHHIVEVLERGCSREEQEAFFSNNSLFYVGKSNKYGCLSGISYPEYIADKIGEFVYDEPNGIAEAFFFEKI